MVLTSAHSHIASILQYSLHNMCNTNDLNITKFDLYNSIKTR